MASATNKTWKKRGNKTKKSGHERKAKESRKSTLTYDELFAGLGEPGKPAPKA